MPYEKKYTIQAFKEQSMGLYFRTVDTILRMELKKKGRNEKKLKRG